MCDIWQGNNNGAQQLTEADVGNLLTSLKKLQTQWVVMSGGEALMNPNLFALCDMLRSAGMKVTILSTGLLLKRYAQQIVEYTDEVIVSLDGSEEAHNFIRRIPNAYQKLRDGVQTVKTGNPAFPISGRCVIQRHNFTNWLNIVDAAHSIGLDQISFLPADVSSEAFNRPDPWNEDKTNDVKLDIGELPRLKSTIEALITNYADDFSSGYIAESPDKISRIYAYYAAFYDLTDYPSVKCNAPWVSAVIEADGSVRPCFFHQTIGNIRENSLPNLLNNPSAITFRQNLDLETDEICQKCVCSLDLPPTVRLQ